MQSQQTHTQHVVDIPVGQLGIIGMKGCERLAGNADAYISQWRKDYHDELIEDVEFIGYSRPTYLVDYSCPRFASGESKGVINQSVRGFDLYVICDCFNYSVTYNMYGTPTAMSPDDHFADLKRIIAAVGHKARRVNVIMPMLYEGRQDKRSGRESLDCALMLQELHAMGIENIITFDAHDTRVSNAIPLCGFENIYPTYQFIKAILNNKRDLILDKSKLMVISPDTGAVGRSIYYANQLGVDMGLFYKRRDYSTIVNGKNPIVAHEFLGDSVQGKDLIIVDDMIASGESCLDVAEKLKARGANRIFICATFGLFTNGGASFDRAFEAGVIDRVFTTNLIYTPPHLLARPWYVSVDLSKYIAYIIDALNHDRSISDLIDPAQRITRAIRIYKEETGQS